MDKLEADLEDFVRLCHLHEKVEKLEQALAEKDQLIERLKQEAEAHAQEARTANHTIAEIYQVVSGATGEPGNWHGAEPVRRRMAEKDKAYQQLMEQAIEFAKCLTGCSSPCTEADWPECRVRRAQAFLKEREHEQKRNKPTQDPTGR